MIANARAKDSLRRAGEAPQQALNPEVLARFDFREARSPVDREVLARLSEAPPPAVTDLQKSGKKPRSRASSRAEGPGAAE